jgi:outer membrane immunogenic protein
MKHQALTGLTALTLFDIVAAHAQVPPPVNWTGFYAGANAGYRWADVRGSAPFGSFPALINGTAGFFPQQTPISFKPSNGVFGIHSGYNFQVTPRSLWGVEWDFSFGKGSSTSSFSATDPRTGAISSNFFSATVNWSTSLRARFGYVNGPWLFYATPGISLLRMTLSGGGGYNASGSVCIDFFDGFCFATADFATTSSSAFSLSKTLAGGVIGFGIERMLPNNLVIRLEYLFAHYGNVNFGSAVINSTFTDTGVFCVCTTNSSVVGNVTGSVTTQTLRVGLSARFP